MAGRVAGKCHDIKPLLDLIERRFDIRLDGSTDHLRSVSEHYRDKRNLMLIEHGEAGAFVRPEYAKALLISEAARIMVLREIDPRPRKKKRKRTKA